MDPDNCDVIIKVLSNVLGRLIDVNKSHVGQQLITKFQSSYPPEVSIHAYLERIKKYAGCSDSCFVVALIYIDRMIEIRNVVLTSLNVHRLIITSLMLAAKFFDDYFYNNAFYAKLGGVAPMEMNSLELEFLQLLNFSLFVSPEVYLKYHAELRNYVGVVNIPVYLSSFPNSPTSDKMLKGNSFLSRPPSTSPFLPLVEITRFPTPPLLESVFDPIQNVQSYYNRIIESNSGVAQVSPYESHSPLLQRTFINSSLPPCDENGAGTAPYGHTPPANFVPDQAIGSGPTFGQYCVLPIRGQYYPNVNGQGRYPQTHYTYQKVYPGADLSGTQFQQTPIKNDERGLEPCGEHQFKKRVESYDSYGRPMTATSKVNCMQQGTASLNYTHHSLQIMSNCPVPILQSGPFTKTAPHHEPKEEYYRPASNGTQKESAPQAQYYSASFPGHPIPQVREARSIRTDRQLTPHGLSPLDFIRISISPSGNGGHESSHYYQIQHQKNHSQASSYPPSRDQYYPRSTDASLSSFSDDIFESGVTTPASDHSTCSSSGLSSRSSCTGLLSVPSESSICSNGSICSNVSSQIFFPQSGGSYYSQQQQNQQTPHYIIAT